MSVNKGQLGGIIGGVGFLMLLLAILINNLSGQDTDTEDTKCTWNSIEICIDSRCRQDTFKNGCKHSKDFCQTQNAGLVYLIFLIMAIILSFIAVLSIFIKYINDKVNKYIRFGFLITTIFCLISITTWIGIGQSSKICFNSSWNNRYLGGSIILPIVSCLVFMIATLLIWKQHKAPNGYETLF